MWDELMSDSAKRRPLDSGALLGRVGRWGVSYIPDGWEFAPGFGVQRLDGGRQVANIRLSEDTLPAGKALAPYLAAQRALFHQTFADPKIAGPSDILFPGADEAALLFLKHGRFEQTPAVIQSQIYVRLGRWIGIVTFTAPEGEFASYKEGYQSLVAALRIADA
jgi:hypothetical protein